MSQPPHLHPDPAVGLAAADPVLPATAPVEVLRLDGASRAAAEDRVIEEVPVALVYNGVSHAVLLATPQFLEDLALGFSLSEGILADRAELYDVEVEAACNGIEVRLDIASRRFAALKERRRTLDGRTGCGLCGVENLSALDRAPGPVPAGAPIAPAAVARAAVADGWRVVLAARRRALLDALAQELGGPDTAIAVACDVTEWDQVEQMADQALAARPSRAETSAATIAARSCSAIRAISRAPRPA